MDHSLAARTAPERAPGSSDSTAPDRRIRDRRMALQLSPNDGFNRPRITSTADIPSPQTRQTTDGEPPSRSRAPCCRVAVREPMPKVRHARASHRLGGGSRCLSGVGWTPTRYQWRRECPASARATDPIGHERATSGQAKLGWLRIRRVQTRRPDMRGGICRALRAIPGRFRVRSGIGEVAGRTLARPTSGHP